MGLLHSVPWSPLSEREETMGLLHSVPLSPLSQGEETMGPSHSVLRPWVPPKFRGE